MRRKFISKIILGTMISTTLCTLVPIKASAEWVKDYQNNWYYTQDNQKMTGWKRIDGQLYYFDDNGKMQTGWIKAGSSWYFLQNNGVLKTGWINYNKNLYYADSSGAMQTGTINVAGKVYMLGDNGVAKTRNTVIDGQFYTIGSNGEVVGMKVPTPDKEFDDSGNVLTVLKNTDNNSTTSPTDSKFNEVIKDQSVSNDDPNQGRTFKVRFKDSNGAELLTKSVKNGKSIDLYEPTKTGYVFASWDTKSDGSGKSYADSDSIKVKEDINLYAQWTDDTATYVDGITVKGSSYVTLNSTTQMTAEVSPSDASNVNVTWSVTSGTGKATIDSNGLLTGVTNGTVTVKATSKDGSNISGMKEVTVSATEVIVPVSQISVTSNTGVSTITANGGTLQMKASVLPTDANNQEVTWSIEDRTGSASIDSITGLVTAKSNGTVTVKATATNKDGSTVVGSTTIAISGQLLKIPVDSIAVAGKDGAKTIDTDAALGGTSGTLQMNATVLPTTATNKLVTWSVVNGTTGKATISSSGLLTASADGTVTVVATAKDGSGKVATTDVAITKQSTKVTGVEVVGKDGATTIETDAALGGDNGKLQMATNLTPGGSSYNTLTWSVENVTGSATIDSNGILTAQSNGTVDVIATITNKDGSKVIGKGTITLKNQNSKIPATSITVAGKDNLSSIITDDGTLQMIATLLPTYTTTTSSAVTWSVINGTGAASINENGLLKAVSNGTVKIKASVTNDDLTVITGTKDITLRGQYIQVSDIAITSANTTNQIEVKGTLQMSAAVNTDATYQNVTWSIENPAGYTGGATINSTTGLLTATSIGDVNVVATADNGKGITKSQKVTIVPQVKVTDISVSGGTAITTDKGILQMQAGIAPTNATNQGVTWSVEKAGDAGTSMTGNATIDANGLLTAAADGTVTVKATAKDGSGVVGLSPVITISGQIIKATAFTLKGYPIIDSVVGTIETAVITGDKGSLQMQTNIFPTNATTTPSAITWSVEQVGDTGTKMTGKASVDSTGKLTAIANGTVTVRATATIAGGIVITGSEVITINGQIIPVTLVKISTTTSTVAINKTLQIKADITPTTATNKTIKWEVTNIDGTPTSAAVIDTTGMITGLVSGTTVKVIATSVDYTTCFDYKYITIS